ncbi:MAG: S24/S26 family peptidase [Anaerolineaceae bacterium]
MNKTSLPCSSAAFSSLSADILRLGKHLRFQAHGMSMRPLVRDGDFVLFEPLADTPARVADVVLCRTGVGGIVVHRVIRRQVSADGCSYLVQGDQAAASDGWIGQEEIYGVLVSLERGGVSIPMRSLRMRLLAGLAALRSRQRLQNRNVSSIIVRLFKRLPVFGIFLN